MAGCCSLFQLTGESDLEKKKGKKMWREAKSIPLPYLRPKILGYSQLGRVPGSQTGPTHPSLGQKPVLSCSGLCP